MVRRAIPGHLLLMVIDRCNICEAEKIWYGHVHRPLHSLETVKGLATPDESQTSLNRILWFSGTTLSS